MLFQTTTQFIVLGLVLVVGLAFGMAARSGGGRKWREKYEDERTAHAAARDKDAAERKSIEADRITAERRVRELEAEVATLRAQPVAVPDRVVAPQVAAVPAGAVPLATAAAAGAPDDLSRIRGIEKAGAERLKTAGITRYAEIERMSATEEADLERTIGAPAGYIARKQWRDQAALLRKGEDAEFERRFGTV